MRRVRFVGVEIVEHKPNYCVIKDLSGADVNEEEFNNALRRIFYLIMQYNEMFYSFDEKKAVELSENLETFKEGISAVAKKLNAEEKEMIYHMKKIRRTLVDLLQFVIELRMDEKAEVTESSSASA